jgi:hypothetical protein
LFLPGRIQPVGGTDEVMHGGEGAGLFSGNAISGTGGSWMAPLSHVGFADRGREITSPLSFARATASDNQTSAMLYPLHRRVDESAESGPIGGRRRCCPSRRRT